LNLRDTAAFALDQAHAVRAQGLEGDERAVRVAGEVRREVAQQQAATEIESQLVFLAD
jgi:hypothetical protein